MGVRMALTGEDLQKIESVVEKTVGGSESRLSTKMDAMEGRLVARMDRMESRIVAGMDLLQRDGTSMLDDHERRIKKLEEAQAKS
jgi:hypothetical protein